MQLNQIAGPPESVQSLPITTFEDTQQMLKAYKKKKRELLKMKENFFKIETEFMKLQQGNVNLEEELSSTKKQLQKLQKTLKQTQIREQSKDINLI